MAAAAKFPGPRSARSALQAVRRAHATDARDVIRCCSLRRTTGRKSRRDDACPTARCANPETRTTYSGTRETTRTTGEGSRSACSCSLDFALDGYLVESCVWLLSYFADHEPVCDTRLTVLCILFLYLTVTSQYIGVGGDSELCARGGANLLPKFQLFPRAAASSFSFCLRCASRFSAMFSYEAPDVGRTA